MFCEEIDIKMQNVTLFDGSNANPVMNMLRYIRENYEGDKRTYIDKDGDKIVGSFRLLLVAHNSSGFDSWVVLNTGLTWLILDSLVNLPAWVKNITVTRAHFMVGFWLQR